MHVYQNMIDGVENPNSTAQIVWKLRTGLNYIEILYKWCVPIVLKYI